MLRHYPVVIHKDKGSDYGVTIPGLPGCYSAGETVTEALAQIKEAIKCHLEGLLLDNEEIPAPASDYSLLTDNPEYSGGIWHLVEIDLNKLDTRTRRINITIPERLLTQVDRFVKDHRLGSRSGFLAQAAETFIEQHR